MQGAGQGGNVSGPPSIFYALGSREERERIMAILMAQPHLGSSLPGGHAAAAARAGLLEVGARPPPSSPSLAAVSNG